MTADDNRPDPLDCDSPAQFLSRLRERLKRQGPTRPRATLQFMVTALGRSSTGSLSAIFNGKRGIQPETAEGFADYFKLSPSEVESFNLLVELDTWRRARLPAAQKEAQIARVRLLLDARRTLKKPLRMVDYFGSWLLIVLREFVRAPRFRPDPEWLSTQLWRRNDVIEIAAALEKLKATGLVRVQEDGRWLLGDTPTPATGHHPELTEGFAKALKRQWSEKAQTMIEAITAVPRDQRQMNSNTAYLTRAEYEEICMRINSIIEEIRHRRSARGDIPAEPGGEVYDLVMALLPVTRSEAQP